MLGSFERMPEMSRAQKSGYFLFKIILIFLGVVFVAYLIFTFTYQHTNNETLPASSTPLELAGDACLTIAENAAGKINAVVEFQRLEKESRKLHVFETCMHDRSYIENPAWQKYAEPLARKTAAEKQLSFDEVFTAMSREHMLQLKPQKDKPIYWLTRK